MEEKSRWRAQQGQRPGGRHKFGALKEQRGIELPYDPAIPHVQGIYLDKIIIQKDTCTPMFIAALCTIAKTWKQLKCPSTDEWIKKMCTYIQWNTTQP